MTEEVGLVPVSQHGQEVLDRVNLIKTKVIENFLELASLLAEVYNNKYFELNGYQNFTDYVEQSGLDINAPTAYKMVKLANTSKLLDVSPEQMKLIRPTKLLEIFSLNPDEHKENIQTLLEEGDANTIDEVKKKVRKAKGLNDEVFYRFNVEKDVSELVIEVAFEKCRQEYGDTIREDTGEVKDISNSRCLELICVEYLNQPPRRSAVIDIKTEEASEFNDHIGTDFQ